MPATSEKQRKFFGAVMGAKKGKKEPSGKAKKVANKMPKKEIKKFLKKEENEEDNESLVKTMKKTGKIIFDGPKGKSRKNFAPATKFETPKKGGPYKRNKTIKETVDIAKFVNCVISNNYSEANKHLTKIIETKLEKIIQQELNKPLFDK